MTLSRWGLVALWTTPVATGSQHFWLQSLNNDPERTLKFCSGVLWTAHCHIISLPTSQIAELQINKNVPFFTWPRQGLHDLHADAGAALPDLPSSHHVVVLRCHLQTLQEGPSTQGTFPNLSLLYYLLEMKSCYVTFRIKLLNYFVFVKLSVHVWPHWISYLCTVGAIVAVQLANQC